MPYIKLLTALAGLALLTACAGGVTINNTNNINVLCGANPFTSTCGDEFATARTDIITECEADAAGTSCPVAITFVCSENPFEVLCYNGSTYVEARNTINESCQDTTAECEAARVMRVCTGNPFVSECDESYDTQRQTRCEGGVRERTDCTATITRICDVTTGNIFDDFCTGLTGTDNSRRTQCETGSVEHRERTDCTATLTRICGATAESIFDSYCDDLTVYEGERKTFCAAGKPNRDAMICMSTIVRSCDATTGNIFDEFCTGLTGIDNLRRMGCETGSRQSRERTECEPTILRICANSIFDSYCDGLLVYQNRRESFCAAGEPNRNDMVCMPTIMRVCGAEGDPFDPFCTGIAGLEELQMERCEMNPVAACFATAGFVSGLTENPPTVPGVDVTGRYRIINLADTNDGVAFFASGVDDNRKYFTGIFPTTDLGALLTSDLGAEWKGRFSAVNNTTGAPFDTDFILMVDFSATTIYALIPTGVRDFFYEIDGSFALDTGLLSGSVEYGSYMGSGKLEPPPSESTDIYISGTLKGSIGQEGAVGAFYGSTTTIAREDAGAETFQLVGGFAVAQPRACSVDSSCADVTTTLWTGSFATGETPPAMPNATTKNEFLAISATTASSLTNVIPTTLFIQDLDGATTDGVAFFRENDAYYAGILAGADLGEPIAELLPKVGWAGKISTVAYNSWGGIDYQATLTNFDFVLDITFDGTDAGTIDALFTRIGRYYSIDGTFDDTGVIEGTVTYGSTTGTGEARAIDTTSDTYSPGTLSGIIGRASALGAFISNNDGAGSAATSFAGGFVARPRIADIDDVTELANYDNWVKGANPASQQDPSATFQFAHSHATEDWLLLNRFNTQTNISTNANTTAKKFSDARYSGESLVGTASEPNFINDGFAYFVESSKFYAGILSDTNMGAPLTQAPAVATWIGEIYSVSNFFQQTASSDLTLTIGFANGRGTISGTSTLASINNNFSKDSVLTYTLSSGSFDTRGVITGSINLTLDVKTTVGNPDERRTAIRNGNFSGLIGARGAVGVFAASSFAGGFFAVPQSFEADTDVSYGDWDDVITTAVATPSTPLANEFLTGSDATGATSVNVINFNNAINENTTFGGDVSDGDFNDGFQIFANTGTGNPTNFYAGILTTTNLGGALVEVADAVWQGHLYAARVDGAGGYEQAQFVLDFDFSTTTISATGIPVRRVSGAALADDVATYGFTAVWDARGVFNAGTITRTLSTVASAGTLTGIIGAEGAVGVFVSNAGAPVGYAGGFVVSPNARWIVRYDDWVGSFDEAPPATIAASNAGTDVFGGFLNLATGATTIAPGDLTLLTMTARGAGNIMPAVSKSLPRASDAMDGVVYITGFRGDNNQTFVGLLPTTNLGAPFPISDESAEWAGTYYDNIGAADTAVTFDINFNDRSIGTTTATTTAGTTPDFDLEFDSAGVITGTVTKNSMEATARGLIGAEGLVGGFVDTTTRTGTLFLFHGGFVADNANNAVAN